MTSMSFGSKQMVLYCSLSIFLGTANVLFVFFGVVLFALAAVGAFFAVYLSVCQIVRLSTPEPLKITVKDRSKQKYFSDIIFGPVLVFVYRSYLSTMVVASQGCA